ncbi:hypothetical protein DPMN_001236 [Dreissena polymorpha]|uniref:Opioid growth factor receptor (OGFr) conserved domain-containing protein n=1 Tax=Dreissena polymorpha TaxID=45954 RepID=A0A9D4MIZ5_DREPO|nr:hypothetical protein DPMN_001236 [Dreissena polymorpha]
MMLDFYGMQLDNDQDGTIVRADNWEDRFHHLNRLHGIEHPGQTDTFRSLSETELEQRNHRSRCD